MQVREPCPLLLALANIALGLFLILGCQDAAGLVNLVVGALLLWAWWHDNGDGTRKKARKQLGARSAALREALARRMAQEAA